MPKPITEDDVITLLKPLDIDDIVISTEPYHLKINYLYNNLNFVYTQVSPNLKGDLKASICAFHNKPKAYLNLGRRRLLSITSDSNISITLTQEEPCSLKTIKGITEYLEEEIYDKLDDLGLIAY